MSKVTPEVSQPLLSSTFVYLLGGELGVVICAAVLLIVCNCLKRKLEKDKRETRRMQKLFNQLDSEILDDMENDDSIEKRSAAKKNKRSDRRHSKLRDVKTIKKKLTIHSEGREVKRPGTPSFFERQSGRKYPIVRICFTGGPCAGKTTAMAHCADQLRQLGIRTYIVPKAASILNRGGVIQPKVDKDREKSLKFHINLLKLQMALEDILVDMGCDFYPEDRVVILCDTGTIDASVTLTRELWSALLDENGWSQVQLRDKRYDLVIHMVTAADGAEEYFKKGNEEDLEEALKMDRRTRQAWVGHPAFW